MQREGKWKKLGGLERVMARMLTISALFVAGVAIHAAISVW